MIAMRGGFGRLGLALGLGVALAGGAWVAALAGGPATCGRVIRVAQKAKKKAPKSKKGMAGKPASSDFGSMPQEKPEESEADDGSLKFSRDIAPVLVGNCIGCHDPKSDNVKAKKLNLTTFKGIMDGTASRKVIEPGNPEDSPLVQRISGEETPKMPPGGGNRAPLAEATVEKIAAWVKQGAKLDGGKDPNAPIRSYARKPDEIRRAALVKLNPEERDKRVLDTGLERWKKINPNTTPETTSGTHFVLFSTLPKERASALVKALDAQYGPVHKLLTPPGVPAMNGPLKVSLYVFPEANTLYELARSLENRELDPNTVSLGNFADEAPYLAAVDPLAGREEQPSEARKGGGKSKGLGGGGTERSLAGILTDQLAGAAASAAKGSLTPRWLSMGLGAYFGSRLDSRSVYYNRLRSEAYVLSQAGWNDNAKAILSDATDTDKLRSGGLSLVEWLAKSEPGAFPQFVNGMLQGTEKLDAGLEALWQMKRDDFVTNWGNWISANYGRAR